jgi:hypothetical protein
MEILEEFFMHGTFFSPLCMLSGWKVSLRPKVLSIRARMKPIRAISLIQVVLKLGEKPHAGDTVEHTTEAIQHGSDMGLSHR